MNKEMDKNRLHIRGKVINKKGVAIPNLLVEIWDPKATGKKKEEKDIYPFSFGSAVTNEDGSFNISITKSGVKKIFNNMGREIAFSFRIFKGKVRKKKEFKKKKQLRDTRNTLLWTTKMEGKPVVLNVEGSEEKPTTGILGFLEEIIDDVHEVSEDLFTAFEDAAIETLEEISLELEEGHGVTLDQIRGKFSQNVRENPQSREIMRIIETDTKVAATQLKQHVIKSIITEVRRQTEPGILIPDDKGEEIEENDIDGITPPAELPSKRLELTPDLFYRLANDPSFDGGEGRISLQTLSEVSGLDIQTVSKVIKQLVFEKKIRGFVHDDSKTVSDPQDDFWVSMDKLKAEREPLPSKPVPPTTTDTQPVHPSRSRPSRGSDDPGIADTRPVHPPPSPSAFDTTTPVLNQRESDHTISQQTTPSEIEESPTEQTIKTVEKPVSGILNEIRKRIILPMVPQTLQGQAKQILGQIPAQDPEEVIEAVKIQIVQKLLPPIKVPQTVEVLDQIAEEALAVEPERQKEKKFIESFYRLADNPAFDGGSSRVSLHTLSEVNDMNIEDVSKLVKKLVFAGKITGFVQDDSKTVGEPRDDLWISTELRAELEKQTKMEAREKVVERPFVERKDDQPTKMETDDIQIEKPVIDVKDEHQINKTRYQNIAKKYPQVDVEDIKTLIDLSQDRKYLAKKIAGEHPKLNLRENHVRKIKYLHEKIGLTPEENAARFANLKNTEVSMIIDLTRDRQFLFGQLAKDYKKYNLKSFEVEDIVKRWQRGG